MAAFTGALQYGEAMMSHRNVPSAGVHFTSFGGRNWAESHQRFMAAVNAGRSRCT